MTSEEKNKVSRILTNASVSIEAVLDKMEHYSIDNTIDDPHEFAKIYCILKNLKEYCYSQNEKL